MNKKMKQLHDKFLIKRTVRTVLTVGWIFLAVFATFLIFYSAIIPKMDMIKSLDSDGIVETTYIVLVIIAVSLGVSVGLMTFGGFYENNWLSAPLAILWVLFLSISILNIAYAKDVMTVVKTVYMCTFLLLMFFSIEFTKMHLFKMNIIDKEYKKELISLLKEMDQEKQKMFEKQEKELKCS